MTRIEANDLFDIYGPLLTERQREILTLSIQEDLSFGEIASELGISRAAAADAVKRGETLLSQYEKQLGIADIRRKVLELLDGQPVLQEQVRQLYASAGLPSAGTE
ncbi:sigma factor-like helix-turn-helix DNA-binding protein [Faecalibaculum rodentium]|uniref:sigma factor-like helix-turn-helix DNA-binding protein n=1 Tax=Faecalibaculum rodentium TaxID=1702221 RepID=UPI0023F31B28|nr:sigma factor-like helix-turn-helix DNA-binding protein [Faecalibaculum rodentium]